jgi:DNA-binding MarR family transcriptional regulator
VPNPNDGRSRLIEVTRAGERRLRETAPSIRELERAVVANLRRDPPDVVDALADVRRAVDLAAADRELG